MNLIAITTQIPVFTALAKVANNGASATRAELIIFVIDVPVALPLKIIDQTKTAAVDLSQALRLITN